MQNQKKQALLYRIALSRAREYPGFTGAKTIKLKKSVEISIFTSNY